MAAGSVALASTPTAGARSPARATSTRCASGSRPAWCAGSARRCSTSSPPGRDVRVPVEMTAAQQEEHDELVPPIAQLMAQARRRPLTQAEFLRLMSLLTQQRIISNGLAQRHFEEVWPGLRAGAPAERDVLPGLFAPKLLELRQLVRQLWW